VIGITPLKAIYSFVSHLSDTDHLLFIEWLICALKGKLKSTALDCALKREKHIDGME
jgi:hypothetical protein